MSNDRTVDEARFSIRLAARMSGISPHTLRMWERRYGFPVPERTPGGARRYTEADVTNLKLVAQALETGYRAGDVVGQSASHLRTLIAEQVPALSGDPPPELDELASAIRRDDVDVVRQQLRQAVAALGPTRFLVEFAHPLALLVGDMWASGEIAIRQEHLATDQLSTQLRTLLGGFDDEQGAPRVLLSTLPDETHGLALDMVALYLAAQHATPLSLGVSTPVREIAAAAMALDADVVGLSVSPAADPEHTTQRLTELIGELPRRVELWVGGQGAQQLDLTAVGATATIGWESIDGELKRWRELNTRAAK